MEYKGMKLVRIEWVDSTSSSYWIDPDKTDISPVHITSFGILYKDTSDYIVIIQNFDEDVNQVSNYMVIPKGCIAKIEDL